ncbi:MAG: hypothetical protein IJ548_04400 [Paludibacteraceae bacterium]|nr:hypothetical protein [Paludibacteraceae bacterium]MBQ9297130.1 hypothetical protein [Paludibacteraceae bacterium]MBR1556473.1 hypothetical protein [Prevotella sp.]
MRKAILTYLFLFECALGYAQATAFPYSCSFEEGEDLSVWTFNYKTGSATDQWMIGGYTHSEGQRSLYISSDGLTPVYGKKPNVVVSYLRYKFPTSTTRQTYDLSFDWRGIGDTTNSCLYVLAIPEQTLFNSASNNPYYLDRLVSETSGILSKNVIESNACLQFGATGRRFLCGSELWQNVSTSTPIAVSSANSQSTFCLVFIWINTPDPASEVQQAGICIDNIQIGDATLKKPANVQVESICEDSVMLVSWESGLAEFEVQYRMVGSSTWRRADGLTDGVDGFTRTNGIYCSYRLQRIREGSYDIRVCGKSGNITTIYTYRNQYLVYCPENHCVAFLDLDGPNVLCTYGYHPNSTTHPGEDPYAHVGRIDFGSDSEESRHTIHTDPTETDPRTDDELLTVPKGALASVRLGNWKQTGEAEAITYSFTVDAVNQGILIVKYATVVQYSGHDRIGEPFFRLEVLDEHGELISESCGHADYAYSDAVEKGDLSGWHISKSNEDIAWKEWTTVGVNLMPYAGQDVKVRFTTSDCYQTAHYGYAYFTVDCASASLETDNCGNDSKIECYAPEGFSYSWYRGNPDDPGNEPFWFERELSTDPGRQEYTCRVSFMDDPDCYFDVSTVSAPRFPVPSYTWEPVFEECTSKIRFRNTSHVMNKYDGTETHTQEPTNDCHWFFRTLSNNVVTESYNWNPVFRCPNQGDSVEVTYTTYIGADNVCDSTRVDTIVMPSILPGHTSFTMTTCPESPVYFGGQWFNTDTVYVGTFPNFAGCDSTSTLHLKVWPEIKDTYRHDSICSDGNVIINGIRYNRPMDNELIMLKSVHGCDSALYMTLTVNERLKMSGANDMHMDVCADEEEMAITFDIIAGQYDSLEINFLTPELRDTMIYVSGLSSVSIPYSPSVTPGHYTAELTFYQFCCGQYREKREVDIHYASSIVEQKWNDVLTLLSPKYNGGYNFTSFQWYKNGQPLEGETHSYLYQPLDMNAFYYVSLTREDGVTITSCPVTPVYHEQQSDYPTIVRAGQRMPMYMEQPATIWYYTVSGQLYSSFRMPQGYTDLYTPDIPGVYILKSINTKGETQAQVMIVEQ